MVLRRERIFSCWDRDRSCDAYFSKTNLRMTSCSARYSFKTSEDFQLWGPGIEVVPRTISFNPAHDGELLVQVVF
jgi:hypothetical protein